MKLRTAKVERLTLLVELDGGHEVRLPVQSSAVYLRDLLGELGAPKAPPPEGAPKLRENLTEHRLAKPAPEMPACLRSLEAPRQGVRRSFTAEQRKAAVAWAKQVGFAQAQRDTTIHENTIRDWSKSSPKDRHPSDGALLREATEVHGISLTKLSVELDYTPDTIAGRLAREKKGRAPLHPLRDRSRARLESLLNEARARSSSNPGTD